MASENELIRGKPQQITTASRVHHDDEEATSASLEFCVAPEGGLNAWLVAAGGSAIFFCCLGFSNSFGTFIEYYKTHQLKGNSPDSIAWIGSLSLFLQFAAGAFGGPLFDLFGSWFMLVQGILQGLVMGCLQFPAFAAVSQYFDKKRAVALGVVVSGSSIGGIIIPLVVSKLLNGSSLDFVFGFASGTIISGASAAFSGCSNDSRNIGTYMGMGMAISALGGLVGPPINGLMVRQFEGFYEVSLLSGTMCLTGGLIALSAKMFTPEGLWGMV
ncbi:putative transporter MCH4 [Glarea lozoyensis 74030]|uniref:Putative transporter MCH4 n=1 Tax=Glarea lozoyensis (strain ATCC 74030 / MF5533) TaxID=1104152 RepID=H0ES84_GLAL7|nr:putative transporter MCH4 [Glarea lozoyensis 74030]